MKPNTLTFVNGLLLTAATGVAVHWYGRAKRAIDAIQYMVEDELDDPDEILKSWSGEQ